MLRAPRVAAEPYYEFEVDVPARIIARAQPTYPDSLRGVGVGGRVLIQFVVDTLGAAEPASVRRLGDGEPASAAAAFTEAARTAILAGRYRAAERGGRKVRQVVQQQFEFSAPRQSDRGVRSYSAER